MLQIIRATAVLTACAIVVAYAVYGITFTAVAGLDPLTTALGIALYITLISTALLRALRLFRPRRE